MLKRHFHFITFALFFPNLQQNPAGFDAEISTPALAVLLQELKENGQFDTYKRKYQELLEIV
ncbi:hypothetical protein WAG13_31835 [Bacillus cereus]|uniref:Uncharacterized protein n=1 Tax=Bacillus thuringiensis TaxID=1428 RepID=A0A9X7G2F6_BACTU|nr:hypothetical protein COK81_10915 [Bacillus thuringiensis]